jgi:hypothetical protein
VTPRDNDDVGTLQISSDGRINFALGHRLFPEHRAYDVPDAATAGLADSDEAVSILESFSHRLAGHLDTFDDEEFEQRSGRLQPRWREIADLCNGASQSANIGLAALCECAGLLGTIPQRFQRRDGLAESRWNALRLGFTLEATAQYLVSIGHYMTNIALRVAIDDPVLHARIPAMNRKPREAMQAAAVVGTEEPAGWLYHSQASAYVGQFGGRSRSLKPLRVAATLFNSKSWSPMTQTRNEAFHRLREEFPTRGSTEATDGLRNTHLQTHSAMRGLGRALPVFVKAMEDAAPPIRLDSGLFPLVSPEEVYQIVDGESVLLKRPHKPFRG